MLYYVEQKEGAWLHPENIQKTMIETVPGQPFEVNFQDLNVDGMFFIYVMRYLIIVRGPIKLYKKDIYFFLSTGQLEIVVSYYDTESEGDDEGYLVAYEQIDFDWREASNWKKHVIADKFVANFFLFGHTMSPGKHRTFYPRRYEMYYRLFIFYYIFV